MSHSIFEIVQKISIHNVNIQLAIQCAPVIANLKASNLLIVQNENVEFVKEILSETDLSYRIILKSNERVTFFVYRAFLLEEYLADRSVIELLSKMGYSEFTLSHLLEWFQYRYQQYEAGNLEFPHEMGVFLCYPMEDVIGFIENKGKNYLHSNYWKVYHNLDECLTIFREYERVTEELIQLVAQGVGMNLIIQSFPQVHQNKTRYR